MFHLSLMSGVYIKYIKQACQASNQSCSYVHVCVAWFCLSAKNYFVILNISFHGLVLQILDFEFLGITLNM